MATSWIERLTPIAIGAAFFFFFVDRTINHDTAWLLAATSKWFDGAELYVGVIEINPPLIFYLTAPPVALAEVSGIKPWNTFYLYLAMLIAVSLVWAGRILRAETAWSPYRRVIALMGFAAAMVLPALAWAGQREQLMVILAMPFIVGCATRPDGDKTTAGAMRAVVAGVGFCLKPHFLAIPIAMTIWRMIERRSLAPALSLSNIVMVCVGAAYATLAAVRHTEYFTEIIPAGRLTYGAIKAADAQVVFGLYWPLAAAFLLLVLLAAAAYRKDAGAAVFCAAALGGAGSYYAQWTGFGYHATPFHCFVLFGFVWILASPAFGRLAIIAPAVLALIFADFIGRGVYRPARLDDLANTFNAIQAGEKVAAFSTAMFPFFPVLVEKEAIWLSKYSMYMYIPGALDALDRLDCERDAGECERHIALLDRSRKDAVDEMLSGPADILIFDLQNPLVDNTRFKMVDFLSQDPRFAAELENFCETSRNETFVVMHRSPEGCANGDPR